MVHQQHGQSSRTMNDRQTKVLRLIDDVSIDIANEINAHRSGNGTCGTLSQLENISIEIEKMRSILNPSEFTPYYPRAIVDSWDFASKLGAKLLDLAGEYQKLR